MRDAEALPLQIAAVAQKDPGRIYLQEVDGLEMTYWEVNRSAHAWAARLSDLGIGPGDHVATILPTRASAVLVWAGVAFLRAVDVPVNTQLRGHLLAHVLQNSGARLLVVSSRYVAQVAAVASEAPNLEQVIVIDEKGADDEAAASELPIPAVRGPGVDSASLLEDDAGPHFYDIATMLYTSGTTGPSKGVMIPWAQLHASATCSWPPEAVNENDCFYAPFSMFHVTARSAIYQMALVGGRVVLREQFKTDRFWEDIEHHGCTTTVLMGVMANFLYRQPGPDTRRTSLRNVLMAPLIPEVEDFKRRFNVRVCTVFNMTEVSSPLTSGGWELANSTSCGRPRAGYECRVVDEFDIEVPTGVVGELIVRPTEPWTSMAGYWGMPEKTVEAWRNLWFHTGDAAMRDEEGNYYFVDRLKDSIRRRGENISSLEVEREVGRHEDVLEVAAIGVPSEWGEEEVKIVVVPKPGRSLRPDALASFLEPLLPPYMVPRYIEIADALPKTPTEKVEKRTLRAAGVTGSTWDRLASRRL